MPSLEICQQWPPEAESYARTQTSPPYLLVMLLILVAPAILVADWPMWGGSPARNMANLAEQNIATEWDVASGKNIRWSAQIGSFCYGNPVVANGRVFVGTNNANPRNPQIQDDRGVLMCFNAHTGEFLWQAVHEKLPSGRENDWPQQGIGSTCAVDGNRVYYVSNRCTLVCADTEGFRDGRNDGIQNEKYQGPFDADFVWELDMMRDLKVYPHFLATSSPLVVDDLVFVHTSNEPDENGLLIPEPESPSFIAVDKHTGRVVWQDNSPGDRLLDGQWSSPTYGRVNGQGQVYFPGGDGWLYAFDPKGDPDHPSRSRLIWKFDCNPPGSQVGRAGRGTVNAILSTAVFDDNRVYIGVGQNPDHGEGTGHLYSIDATRTGDVSEFIGDWDPKRRAKVNATKNPNSALIWHFGDKDFGRTISTVAIRGELLFAVELAGFLHCLDVRTGRPHWKHDMLSYVWGSPAAIGNHVYLGDEDGDVCVLAASSDFEMLHEMHMNERITGTAIASGGVLYLASTNRLFAIATK